MDFMKGVKNNGAANPITFDFSGLVVDGTQKAVQRFLLYVMTERGSVKASPDYGSNLFSDLRVANLSNDSEIQSLFSAAFSNALSYETTQVQAGTIDENESVSHYEIVGFSTGSVSVSVTVSLTIGDGTQTVTVPIPFNG